MCLADLGKEHEDYLPTGIGITLSTADDRKTLLPRCLMNSCVITALNMELIFPIFQEYALTKHEDRCKTVSPEMTSSYFFSSFSKYR